MAVIVAKEHRLPYTATEFDAKIAKIDELSDAIENISADYVIEQNNQSEQKFWRGTKAEYDAIENKDEDVFYIVTDSEVTYDVVTSFNGRVGEIAPQTGDYDANMIAFDDGETVQQKFDNGDLAGGSGITISPDEPEDGDIWIDVDDMPENESLVVATFNGRNGDVVPQAGDYTAEMVGAADVEHNHSADDIVTGTLSANVVAQSGTDYSASRIRNIYAGTEDMTAGTTELASGSIYLVYE